MLVHRVLVSRCQLSTAATGKHSLKFTEAAAGKYPWTPHVYARLRYDSGVVRQRFDLRVEPGAHLNCQWRDWPAMATRYVTAPSITARPDGSLLAGGKKLLSLPPGQWVHVEIVCAIGARVGGTYSVSVTLPGRQQPKVFVGLPLPSDFHRVDWIGLCSFGTAGTVFYLDNLKIWREHR